MVFVAGWSSTASFSWPAVTVWLMHGYSMEELYGTSYGIPVGLVSFHWGLQCQYVNAVGARPLRSLLSPRPAR